MLSRLSTLRQSRRGFSTLPSWATLDPSTLGTSSTPHSVSNLVAGQWTTSSKTLTIPNPMDRDAPPVCTVPDTSVEELRPFVESLSGVPKSGVHNPLKNVERYLMFGEISRKVRTVGLVYVVVIDFGSYMLSLNPVENMKSTYRVRP